MSSDNNITTAAQWLSPAEVAAYFHVSPITVRSWANKGKLAAQTTAGGHRRYALGDVQRLAKQLNHSADATDHSAHKVLIIDDDSTVADLLKIHIEQYDQQCEVILADNGFVAGALVREHHPKIIFLDLMMPGMSGDAVCRYIKEDCDLDIPVIGITGYLTDENRKKMKQAGAETVLGKPFDIPLLHQAIDKALKP